MTGRPVALRRELPAKPGDQVVIVDADALPAATFDLVLAGRYRLWATREGPTSWEVARRWPFVRRRWRCIVRLQLVGP